MPGSMPLHRSVVCATFAFALAACGASPSSLPSDAAIGDDASSGDAALSSDAGCVSAEGGAWRSLCPMGMVPRARSVHTAIYDEPRQRMVIFGGENTEHDLFGDAFALSLGATEPPAWMNITPAGTISRAGHSAIYDALHQEMIIYGGFDGSWLTSEVWALSLSGTPAWRKLSPQGTPPPLRLYQGAVYDAANERMLVFGGYDPSVMPDPISYNDVWALTLPASGEPTWSQLTPTATPPAPRAFAGITMDGAGRLIVAMGQDLGRHRFNDTFALPFVSGVPGDWSAITPVDPPLAPRDNSSLIYHPGGDRLILFGGYTATAATFDAPDGLQETWLLPLTGTAWQSATLSNPPPPGYGHTAILDPIGDRMVIFGGSRGLREERRVTSSVFTLELSSAYLP